jgi:hypothetical protein
LHPENDDGSSTDIDSNQLRRASGNLVEVARVDGVAGSHNGACATLSGLDGGLLLSQFKSTASPETFRIFNSQVSLP